MSTALTDTITSAMSSPTSTTKPKVVIVGAGIAGVTAAVKLIHNGIDDVIILEAQDYIGGRIKGIRTSQDGKVVDLGAQYIHGKRNNPLFDIAEKLNMLAYPDEFDRGNHNEFEVFHTSDGKTVRRRDVQELITIIRKASGEEDDGESDSNSGDDNAESDDVMDGGAADRETWRSQFGEKGNVKQSVMKAFEKFLKTKEPLTPEKKEVYEAALRWTMLETCTDNAVDDISDISLYLWDEYKEMPGDRWTELTDGVSGLMKAIASVLPKDKEIVRLNCPVVKVDWDIPQNASNSSLPVRVTLQSGEVIEADHVIVTVSLGCLKAQHETMFEPKLPTQTVQLIDKLGFGGIGKLFLFFERPFWPVSDEEKDEDDDEDESIEFLWLDSHMPDIPRDKSKAKTKSGKPWYRFFSMLSPFGHPNALEIWLSNEQSEACEPLDDQEVMDVAIDVIRTFLPETKVPDPIAIYRTKWLTNPYTRGTYSHLTPELTLSDLENMDNPLPSQEDPRLMLAGEAFHRHFGSTAHGAMLSGGQQADRILAKYDLEAENDIVELIRVPSIKF